MQDKPQLIDDFIMLVTAQTRMSLSGAHSSAKTQQSPYETTFKLTRSRFFLNLHQIAHTHRYQSSKHSLFFFIKIHELFSEKSTKC